MKLLVTLGAFLFAGFLHAAPMHNIVVFGDSLSDNGNLYEFMNHQLPQSPPYYAGRFSNGPVWVEHVIASYFPNTHEQHLFDYAVGGSGVSEEDDDVLFTLKRQVNTYLIANQDKANPDDLYVIWIGANNYLGLPEETQQTLDDVNMGIIHSVDVLIEKGARHILLFNLPDLGKTPAATEFDAADQMGYFSHKHNEMLYQSYLTLQQKYPGIDWMFFDLASMFDDVVEHPDTYGFTNVTGMCSNALANDYTRKSVLRMVSKVTPKASKDACDGYLFFDLVHPTGLAHSLIAEKVRLMFDSLGVEFSE